MIYKQNNSHREGDHMFSENKVSLIGHAANDPEVRYMPDGQPCFSLRVATNERWTNNDGVKKERADFHQIVGYGKLAELTEQYVSKGSYLRIEGKLRNRSYEDRDGNKRYVTEIVAKTVGFLDKKGNGSAAPEPAGPEACDAEQVPDEVPF
jgi:single-strand DNA-binding protein